MADIKYPDDLKYAESDEWVRIEDNIATIGISDYAQDALNDLVYVELPNVGDKLAKGDQLAAVESVKAAADVYAIVGGTVKEVNTALEDEPELINSDPYGEGWIARLELDGEADTSDLMNAADYKSHNDNR
jgi:glycine cleavage system H protein